MQRVALVAGGTGDIGRSVCHELHANGVRVAVGYARSRQAAEALASDIGGMAVPLSTDDDVRETGRTVQDAFGRLDILVNAAGVNIESSAPAMHEKDWQTVLDVNLTFAFRLTQAVLPCFLPQRYGRIVHISSIAGRTGGRGQINYAAAKAGLERMARVFALEVGRKGVTVNCVAPGVIITKMSERIRSAHAVELLERISCRRFGEPEDVARAVTFLTGEGAGYINGAVLPVDGGMLL
jgi:NAD(P)-dependent dehydrogenase (short-subunit alcohol dehydrogenase family)